MSGGADPYRAARENLVRVLRVLQVYGPEAIVVVGAQAVDLQCGPDDLPFAPFTLDSDIAVDPRVLAQVPPIRRVLEGQGYRLRDGQPGLYRTTAKNDGPTAGSAVDILVPEEFAFGRGSRDARLPGDNERAARRTAGLEAALYDKDLRAIVAPGDANMVESYVAGPAALIIAKAQMISERTDDHVKPKDAADVFRLLRAHERTTLQQRFTALGEVREIAGPLARGLQAIHDVFVTGPKGRLLFASLLTEDDRGELLASYDALVQDLGWAIE